MTKLLPQMCTFIVLPLAIACSARAPIAAAPDCSAETAMVELRANVAQAVSFSWQPRCTVAVLIVEEGSSDRWAITTAMETWTVPERANVIQPGVVYGQAPTGAEVREPPATLSPGKEYTVSLWRILPEGSAAEC